MQTLARLFGRSPFAPLQAHMAKVADCVHAINPLFEALATSNFDAVNKIAAEISKREHEADLAKNDIRNHLPTGLFLPIDRNTLLEILSLQDSIADRAENIGVLMTLKPLHPLKELASSFPAFINKNLQAFEDVFHIICEMGRLLESSFGGCEADKVMQLVNQVAIKEQESDLLQRTVLKVLLSLNPPLDAATFFLWTRIMQEVSSLSDDSEKLANRVRMILEVK